MLKEDGEDLGIQKRAMLHPRRGCESQLCNQLVEAVTRGLHHRLGQRDGVMEFQVRDGQPARVKLMQKDLAVKTRVMGKAGRTVDEGEHLVGLLMEARLSGEELVGQPMNPQGAPMHLALRIEIALPGAAGPAPAHHLHEADIDRPVAIARAGPCGLAIGNDEAHGQAPI